MVMATRSYQDRRRRQRARQRQAFFVLSWLGISVMAAMLIIPLIELFVYGFHGDLAIGALVGTIISVIVSWLIAVVEVEY